MELLSMVVFKENAEEVIAHLLKLGVFHPVDIRNIEAGLSDLSAFQMEKEHSDWEALEINLREILRKLKLTAYPTAIKETETSNCEQLKELLSGIDEKITPLADRRDDLIEELKTKESIFSQIKEYFPIPLKKGSFYTFLEIALGKIEEKNIPALERSLKEIPHLAYPFNRSDSGKVITLVIGLRRDRVLIDRVLRDMGWEKLEYPEHMQDLSVDVEAQLKAQIAECKRKIEEVGRQIKSLAEGLKEKLAAVISLIHLKKSLLEAKRFSCVTEKTVLLSGWVPREEKEKVTEEVKRIAQVFYIEGKSPQELGIPKDEVPVRLKHNPFFKPFELLVDSYGLPRYGTVDPTIFVAISFLLMFGAMFGDVGHGLVLLISSLFLRRSKKENVKKASVLIGYCGLSSVVFGALFGSFFGLEFPSLWFKPMDNIIEIFRLSIFFGMGMISLGILLNIINALRDRDYIRAIFDKAGLIVGIIYWLAIAVVSKYLAAKIAPSRLYINLIAIGFILIFLRPVIELVLHKKKENIFMSLMESMVEILEIFMGYLSNTVSFMRIAAYAITHFSLFLAIFELSRVLKGAGFLVLIAGNILIILLEGLVSSIQSIRLNYYEFFSKFFITGRQAYKPLTAEIKD